MPGTAMQNFLYQKEKKGKKQCCFHWNQDTTFITAISAASPITKCPPPKRTRTFMAFPICWTANDWFIPLLLRPLHRQAISFSFPDMYTAEAAISPINLMSIFCSNFQIVWSMTFFRQSASRAITSCAPNTLFILRKAHRTAFLPFCMTWKKNGTLTINIPNCF